MTSAVAHRVLCAPPTMNKTLTVPCFLAALLGACATEPETTTTEQEATVALLKCEGPGIQVVDTSAEGRQWPVNVVDGGIRHLHQWMSETPGYTAKLYDTKEAAEADLPEVCASFGSAAGEALKDGVGAIAKDACVGALFRAFTCEQCENGAGDKCEQEIREGSCEWRPGVEPTLSVSQHITAVAPPVDPDIRVIVSPLPLPRTEPTQPAPGTKYKGDCLLTAIAAARITDNLVGCGAANSCD